MFKTLNRLTSEVRRVKRILAPADYRRWRRGLLAGLPRVLAQRSLGPVDEAFGETFDLRQDGRPLHLQQASFGLAREIFGQECYCPATELGACRQILDLGANAGVFGLFALSAAPAAIVHLVEAQAALMPALTDNMTRNGFAGRVRIENALVGGEHDEWTRQLCRQHPALPIFSMADYLAKAGECDFLKCDIEGAEYALFSGDLTWLARVRRLALEYHGSWAQGSELKQTLARNGFQVVQASHGSLGYLFAKRS